MEALLKHLVDMTGQRDHALLDRSVASALHELVGAEQVHVHELFQFRGEQFLRLRAWVRDGLAGSVGDAASEQAGEPARHFPVLLECITQRAPSGEEVNAAGQQTLWLPVWLNDKVKTCLQLTAAAPFPPAARHMIEGILSVYRNFQSILDYSEHDTLTGLLNRKTFDEKFSRMLTTTIPGGPQDQPERRAQHGSAIAHWLGVIDIDHFKRVNDQFGHLYGDEVLILVANLLRSSFRSQDRVFRFGGEEFVILLRSTTLEDAHRIFDRFRHNVEQYDFPQVGRVTISLGFASISAESPVVILGHADQALYYAKSNGRNQVCFYDELVRRGELCSEVSNDAVEFF